MLGMVCLAGQYGLTELFHGDSLFGTIVYAEAAAKAILSCDAFPVDNCASAEGTHLNARQAPLALVPVGHCSEETVNERVIELPELPVDDIGDTAAGTAVADGIFVVEVHGAVNEHHVEHLFFMARCDDRFRFLF